MLFVLDGLTFLAYVFVLGFIHDPGTAPLAEGESAGSYGEVLRDRLFLGLWTLNFLFVAAGYSLINLLPPFIRDQSQRHREGDRLHLLLQHDHDRARAAADVALDRGATSLTRARR